MIRKLQSNKTLTTVLLNSVLVCLFIFSINITHAIPAYPKPVVIVQPDGSELTIRKHGDEFFNWTTTTSGHTIMQKDDGYYYYVIYGAGGIAQVTDQRVSQTKSIDGEKAFTSKLAPQSMSMIASSASSNRRRVMLSNMQKTKFPNEGNIKSIVILVEYQDIRFTITNPQASFTDILNLQGYSNNGATGSAKDYFLKSSGGKFSGEFDIVGPYRLSQNMAYYGGNNASGNDIKPAEMVEEAVRLADNSGIDFSQYDKNNDGRIDNVFIYYAGYNEAEYGPENSIWPHRWVVYSSPVFDGKTLYDYACTSELRGYKGNEIASIGVFCHEFSHVFGLADHYDTNGDEGGYSAGLGYYDIMTSGSFNNSGNTPPLFNAFEMEQVGWLEPKMAANHIGDITLQTIDHLEAYKILTEVPGEYFLIENRQKDDPNNIWDKYIPESGLIITHVDRSAKIMERWELNTPNADVSHECLRFVVAGNTDLNDFQNWKKVPYPYSTNNKFTATSFPRAISWAGVSIPHNISNISVKGLDVKFSITSLIDQQITIGIISDSYGNPVTGAEITFTPISKSNRSVGKSPTKATTTTTSNNSGEYTAELLIGDYKMTIVKAGFNTHEQEVTIESGISKFDVKLINPSLIPVISLDKYEYSATELATLKVINVTDTDVIEWYIDKNEVINLNTYLFDIGKHTIKAIVTRRIGNTIVRYVIVKQIVVK